MNIKFKADKASGIESSIYGSAFFSEILRIQNIRHRFKFPWYALTYNAEKVKADEWIDEEKYSVVCDKILQFVRKNGLSYFRQLNEVQKKENIEFINYCNIALKKISSLSDSRLIVFYYEFIQKYFWYYAWGCLTFLYEQIFSERLVNSLSERYTNTTETVGALLETGYKSFMVESEELLFDIKNSKSQMEKSKLIKKYLDNYFCMDTNYGYSPVMDEKAIIAKANKIKENSRQKNVNRHIMNSATFKNKLVADEQIIVDILKLSELVHDKRKHIAMSGVYVLYRFLDEAVKRGGIKAKIAEKAFWFEFSDLIQNTEEIEERLAKRKAASIVLDNLDLIYSEEIIVEDREVVLKNSKEIKGTAASKGIYKGIVKLILSRKDFNKLTKGDILAAEMTRPDFLPIMKLAGAIITDEGGLTCHAAIVSREMEIPCIVGAKNATRILKDGDLVEVDANKGVVKIIK
jgi:phosphohistidine swiveling domain-containing protein